MKIGILTFHRAENFGAVMQCWSLCQYLSHQGHDVEVIDYRCKEIERGYEIFSPPLFIHSCFPQLARTYQALATQIKAATRVSALSRFTSLHD